MDNAAKPSFVSVEQVAEGWTVDVGRMLLTGMSDGGTFTYVLGLRAGCRFTHLAPVAAVNIWYGVGSKNEVPGKTGFAHLFEHVMFQGSKNVSKAEHIALIEAAGAHISPLGHRAENVPPDTTLVVYTSVLALTAAISLWYLLVSPRTRSSTCFQARSENACATPARSTRRGRRGC